MSTGKIVFEEIRQIDKISALLLDQKELHVWKLNLTNFPDNASGYLDTKELQRYQRIIPEQQKNRFLASRYWLRQILSDYLNCPLHELQFTSGEKGKPALITPGIKLEFNLTHTGDYAALAIAIDTQVGIDIESIRGKINTVKIARQLFSVNEIEQLEALPTQQQSNYFFECWTRMEARQKCMGLGIFNEKVADEQVVTKSWELDENLLLSVAWSDREWQPLVRFLEPGV
ncbi:4'-phosphopantetheinyl transferase family protein [Solemya velum gill symbiont]|uniref:4'-phosphopantetheinyl transferase family protein n=1 Tax=Solemya velum gill symbiont TaxID=2340 RepID=UPI0009981610|nr:4'-phosphopantetheinyl transferase superfamily protein [Solemya velum gill symbiont]OOY59153.1 hypothetical protein BOW02_11030 [Solemya velum gill symbiont]OOY85117.1 hypothetical protein BOW13_05855 [Solemya velum gill symbiont]OOY92398.1 hypothetical protein BOW15_03495 [Solemya velum gill symbiont]OOZ43433.1 hypothetical protein BOW37_11080 [Solemya velum gill symbiont]OOZ44865.1 hypothetical protein BOW38_10900 [Solemya velum gill symbiont]